MITNIPPNMIFLKYCIFLGSFSQQFLILFNKMPTKSMVQGTTSTKNKPYTIYNKYKQ